MTSEQSHVAGLCNCVRSDFC